MEKLLSKQGFWSTLERPIYCLAPMADVTDAVFRLLIARHAKPDILFTEFVAVDGLCSAGRERLLRDLEFHELERPVVAQLFGTNPDHFVEAAKLMVELGFDGIDINMGCPVKVITKQGAGSWLIKEHQLAREIIQATIEGAGELPVSVKTRIGYSQIEIEEWTANLVAANPVAIILHLRTRKEMSKVAAHWEVMPQAVEVVRGSDVLLLGNGDVMTLDQADQLVAATGIDGIMFGRAVYGNPWLFDRTRRPEEITLTERFDAMIEHADLYEEMFPGRNFLIMRKHLRAHAAGFDGAKELRIALMRITCAEDVRRVVAEFRPRFITPTS